MARRRRVRVSRPAPPDSRPRAAARPRATVTSHATPRPRRRRRAPPGCARAAPDAAVIAVTDECAAGQHAHRRRADRQRRGCDAQGQLEQAARSRSCARPRRRARPQTLVGRGRSGASRRPRSRPTSTRASRSSRPSGASAENGSETSQRAVLLLGSASYTVAAESWAGSPVIYAVSGDQVRRDPGRAVGAGEGAASSDPEGAEAWTAAD